MENDNYLFELIQGIQSKLSEETPVSEKEETTNEKNNFNISDLLKNINLSSILGNNTNSNSTPGTGIDINTIMKFQNIFSSMNREDPRKNLLVSLKPFLRKSRQEKLNEYITYLSIGNALGIFDDKGSGN